MYEREREWENLWVTRRRRRRLVIRVLGKNVFKKWARHDKTRYAVWTKMKFDGVPMSVSQWVGQWESGASYESVKDGEWSSSPTAPLNKIWDGAIINFKKKKEESRTQKWEMDEEDGMNGQEWGRQNEEEDRWMDIDARMDESCQSLKKFYFSAALSAFFNIFCCQRKREREEIIILQVVSRWKERKEDCSFESPFDFCSFFFFPLSCKRGWKLIRRLCHPRDGPLKVPVLKREERERGAMKRRKWFSTLSPTEIGSKKFLVLHIFFSFFVGNP